MDKVRPFRYTRGKLSIEVTLAIMLSAWLWRAFTWGYRRCKPIAYHPTALIGTTAFIASYLINPWFTALLVWYIVIAAYVYPDTYLRHIQWRIDSFLAGFQYRHRPRRKLTANGLLNDQDPVPTISAVHKEGCITRVRVKMSHGDEINYWRERSARLAQTYNAGDCKINPYRRETLNPFKHEMVTKYRWLELEFLTKDPFNSKLGTEYIDYHRDNTLTPIQAVHRDGIPDRHELAAHRLRVAMSRWGKSNAIRAMIYAQRHNIDAGLIELWGIDGKGGIEQSFLQHAFTRVAYGDSELNPDSYNPAEFDRLLKDAVKVMKRRQRRMRGIVTEHTPTPEEPWLLIVIDEILVLTNKAVTSALRTSIAASINLIFQQGIACGVSIDASTQLGKKDNFDPIERDGFTQFELGKVEPGVVDMIFGKGWWDRGARADELAKDLKGSFFKKTDTTMAPDQLRYPNIPVADVSARALGFDKAGKSVLWPPKHLQAVRTEPESVESPPESEPEVFNEYGGFA